MSGGPAAVAARPIVVDTNAGETALYSALVQRFGAEQVERRRLDVGDVMLTSGASGDVLLVERKTWPDLAKSLSDGRYAEQKARLLSAVFAGAEEASDEDADGPARMLAPVRLVQCPRLDPATCYSPMWSAVKLPGVRFLQPRRGGIPRT